MCFIFNYLIAVDDRGVFADLRNIRLTHFPDDEQYAMTLQPSTDQIDAANLFTSNCTGKYPPQYGQRRSSVSGAAPLSRLPPGLRQARRRARIASTPAAPSATGSIMTLSSGAGSGSPTHTDAVLFRPIRTDWHSCPAEQGGSHSAAYAGDV